jgi:hypothetical protein
LPRLAAHPTGLAQQSVCSEPGSDSSVLTEDRGAKAHEEEQVLLLVCVQRLALART